MAQADPSPQLRDLLARRNQLEVLLAALERRSPRVAEAGVARDAEGERARRQWELIQHELDAVQAKLGAL